MINQMWHSSIHFTSNNKKSWIRRTKKHFFKGYFYRWLVFMNCHLKEYQHREKLQSFTKVRIESGNLVNTSASLLSECKTDSREAILPALIIVSASCSIFDAWFHFWKHREKKKPWWDFFPGFSLCLWHVYSLGFLNMKILAGFWEGLVSFLQHCIMLSLFCMWIDE